MFSFFYNLRYAPGYQFTTKYFLGCFRKFGRFLSIREVVIQNCSIIFRGSNCSRIILSRKSQLTKVSQGCIDQHRAQGRTCNGKHNRLFADLCKRVCENASTAQQAEKQRCSVGRRHENLFIFSERSRQPRHMFARLLALLLKVPPFRVICPLKLAKCPACSIKYRFAN